ncbi:MAG: UPF0179 family protein [Methanobacteriaceae archaeon]|nr:UPF0179 family protein [Methanobacteriaceae archaeon]
MITLIGKSLAMKGLKFLHYGAATECERCRFKNTCIDSLKEGRMYLIKNVKDTEHHCPIHEGHKVRVVEVEKAHINTLVDSKSAFEGSMLIFKYPDCEDECLMRDLCFPEGLKNGDKCKIVKNKGKPKNKCIKGMNLTEVVLSIKS